jgi:transcriptional regulator with XRE-family HTH domain
MTTTAQDLTAILAAHLGVDADDLTAHITAVADRTHREQAKTRVLDDIRAATSARRDAERAWRDGLSAGDALTIPHGDLALAAGITRQAVSQALNRIRQRVS